MQTNIFLVVHGCVGCSKEKVFIFSGCYFYVICVRMEHLCKENRFADLICQNGLFVLTISCVFFALILGVTVHLS